jgi:hypothetical protein
MSYQQRELSGSLFKNQKKEKETHPDATGTALIDGVEYYVSAWTKTGAKGRWQSLAFKRKDKQETRQQPASRQGKPAAQDDDGDIPF